MRADDLKLGELVDFSEGKVHLHGRRLVLHDLHAFSQHRKDLVDLVGMEEARRIFTRFGYFWGQADAAAMKRIFNWDSRAEWIKAGPRMHALQGVVKPVVKHLETEERFRMLVHWHDSEEAEEHRLAFGTGDCCACWILVGYASGYASFCMDTDIYFIEEKCRAKGDRICTAEGLDRPSWGDRIEPYLKFFQADGIHGKILELTEELRRKTKELNAQRKRLKQRDELDFGQVRNQAFRHMLELARRIAPFETSVLITGETGTGKEVLARHIHRLSNRSKGPFQSINCGALPETLLESELFGHKKGAFTGAVEDRTGLFEDGSGGTVFLDEIGDISSVTQIKLLPVLQQREIPRIGENRPRKVDIRILSATNKDLNEAVAEGRFRQDLLFRLRVIEIQMPPLRDRTEDILPLAREFVERLAKQLKRQDLRLDATTLDYLQAYSWPGNVRELENAMERAAVLCGDAVIKPQDLPPEIVQRTRLQAGNVMRSLAQVEADHIFAVLDTTGGNKKQAAEILGISYATLWRRLKSL